MPFQHSLDDQIIDLIITDLVHKPLFIVADPREGKTVIAKEIVKRFS